ncbi:MAG: c-type cytochrome biogenesis protein CcmI [Azovibrio sp.]|uniref:c-type cytochrome biogenesis protein CcmI n=1 Tax=Azovibrio sp. TaxID=1872673 RepID=UPI003C7885C8
MTIFLLAALALLAATALFLLPPLLRSGSRAPTQVAQRETNQAILRDQLAELEQERQEGDLSGADFTQARDELKQRILEETAQADASPAQARDTPSTALAIALLLGLTVAAVAGYALLGTPAALDPAMRQARPQAPAMTPEQIEAMVARLAARLAENPDDEQGWVMLARSYKVMGRLEDAAQAYAKAGKRVATDAALLTDYAETLALSSGKGFKGKPSELLQQALKLNPEYGQALLLAGAAALEAGDKTRAADYWEKVLPQVEPGSELHTLLVANIEKIRSKKKAPPTKPGEPGKP